MASFRALGRAVAASTGRRVSLLLPGGRSVVAPPSSLTRRWLSAETAVKPAAAAAATEVVVKKGGSSFMQRLGAFLAGAGLGCGVGYYHLANEIEGSTVALEAAIAKNHRDLSDRLSKLERS